MTQRLRLDFVTWFRLPGHAVVGADDFHVIWTGFMALPHVGVVNRLMRRPAEPSRRLELIALHERGHFETLPAAVLLFLWLNRSRERRGVPSLSGRVADVIAHAVAWEGLAEAWLVGREGRAYPWPSRTRMLIFWLTVAASCAWIVRQSSDGTDS